MGAKGSSSMTTDYADEPAPFMTAEGWNEFERRLEMLHNKATPGQTTGIMREVQEWEKQNCVGVHQEQEYNEAMKAQELYEKLCNGD